MQQQQCKKIVIPCGNCGGKVEAEVHMPPVTMNLLYTSIVIIEHEGEIICPNCHVKVVPVVAALAGVQIICRPIEDSKVITPGSGLVI